MRLAPCTTLHLSTWRSQGWKFCLLSLVSACFGDHELLEGQGLASQDHCCFLHAHPPPKKKKKKYRATQVLVEQPWSGCSSQQRTLTQLYSVPLCLKCWRNNNKQNRQNALLSWC